MSGGSEAKFGGSLHELEGLAALEGDADDAGHAVGSAGVNGDAIGEECFQAVEEAVAKVGDTIFYFGGPLVGESDSLSETDDIGDIFHAGSETAFLAIAHEQRSEGSTVSDVEGTDPFGTVEFVGGEGEKIDLEGFDIAIEFTDGLAGIGVDDEGAVGAEVGDFADGLDRANFMVHVHDADESCIFGEGGFNLGRVE